MIGFLEELVRNHGWHVAAELGALVLVIIFAAPHLTALARGRVRAVTSSLCGRVASRAHGRCPACRRPLEAA